MATLSNLPPRGKWRHVIKLEDPLKAPDGSGGQTEDYEEWVTLRGYFRQKSGSRNFESGYDQLVTEYEAFIPWRSEFENNMTKDTRLIYDNRVFKILKKEFVEEIRHVIALTLTSVE